MKISIWPGGANGKQIWELQEAQNKKLAITNININTKIKNTQM